jgi:hypothetical protein
MCEGKSKNFGDLVRRKMLSIIGECEKARENECRRVRD